MSIKKVLHLFKDSTQVIFYTNHIAAIIKIINFEP